MKTYKGLITSLPERAIFVFGSNYQGRHGAGSAAVAKAKFGAKTRQGNGLMGQSYGIATKDLTKRKHPSVSTSDVKKQIKTLYEFAEINPTYEFYIAYSDKGPYLSGFTPQQMADMFSCTDIPDNIVFEEGFSKLLTIKV